MKFNSVGDYFYDGDQGIEMFNRYFELDNKNDKVLSESGVVQKAKFWISMGNWSNLRDQGFHIVFGSTYHKFHGYFIQFDLAQGREDEEYFYILKKLDKSGSGACTRLFGGDGTLSDEDKKKKFKKLFVPEFVDDKWFIITKISKKDIENPKMNEDILSKLLEDMIRFIFIIEEVRMS